MLFSKQCVCHNAPFFFCFVCWMITIPYTVDFHESKSSMTACFFSFIPVVVAKSFQKHRLTRGLFCFFNFGDFTFTQESTCLALNTNVKRTWVNLSRFLSLFLLSPRPAGKRMQKPNHHNGREEKLLGEVQYSGPFHCLPFANQKDVYILEMCSDPRFSSLLPPLFCVFYLSIFLSHPIIRRKRLLNVEKQVVEKAWHKKNEPLQKYMLMGRGAFFVPFSLRCATELDWFERLYIFFQIWVNFSRSNCALRSFFCV